MRLLRTVPLLALLLTACPTDEPEPEVDVCADAAEELGYRPCVIAVPDLQLWEDITVPTGLPGQLRATKYQVPARPDARLPTLFLDAGAFLLHYELLVTAFPDLFPGLGTGGYLDLILDPESREFYAGTVTEHLLDDGSRLFGFVIWDDPADPDGAITLADAEATYAALQEVFAPEPLAFVPSNNRQAADAAGWDASFPIHGLDDGVEYEAYTVATGYGTLRFVPIERLEQAIADAEFGFQDIVVLEDAPVDLEVVVSGAVTGGRQNELSHLNVRSAARGTPNCFVRDPFEALAGWEGVLVRLTCGEEALAIEETTPDEAQAFWDALVPEPVDVPAPDLEHDAITPLLELPTATEQERLLALSRFGAKGSTLGVLYQRIDGDLQLQGLVIPFHYYDAFMESGTWTVDGDELSFAATIDAWLADDDFLLDAALRRQRLEELRAAMQATPPDPELLDALAGAIDATWGDPQHMVRFRSSSNAEDSLRFSGAGLYDSTSACLADELDGDDVGPSLCDPDQPDERSLVRALTRVWSSLWKMTAFEERQWWGIDHHQVAMGVLVNDRSKDEQANIVVFTGDPNTPGDDRYVVNAQLGDLSVVSPGPGEVVELTLLTVEDGQVTAIERVRESSETAPGVPVLSDARLEELGAAMATVADVLPIDEEPPEGGEVLLDSEWKVLEDGRLIIKQVRPFLRME